MVLHNSLLSPHIYIHCTNMPTCPRHNNRHMIPLPAWKAEREELTAKRNRLNQRFYTLKDEVKEVEKIHTNVYDILREETREAQRTRARDMEH